GRRDAATAAALRRSLDETGVPVEHATDLIVAFIRDATTPRTPDMAALLDYCRYSAAPVGRYLLDLHGESRASWPASDALCASLQILNHLQDLKGDWRDLGRCYLPDDLMAAHGVRPDDVLEERASPGLRLVMDRLLDECDRLNAAAATLPGLIRDRRMRLEAATILALARR
ncbi:squalene/phytoene synthase family protein, partial [Endobacter medicaginis]